MRQSIRKHYAEELELIQRLRAEDSDLCTKAATALESLLNDVEGWMDQADIAWEVGHEVGHEEVARYQNN